MNNFTIIQKITNVRNALDELEAALKETKLNNSTIKRRAYTDALREKIYERIGELDESNTYATSDIRAIKPSDATMNLMGRCLRDMGWMSKTMRINGVVTRKWVYVQ